MRTTKDLTPRKAMHEFLDDKTGAAPCGSGCGRRENDSYEHGEDCPLGSDVAPCRCFQPEKPDEPYRIVHFDGRTEPGDHKTENVGFRCEDPRCWDAFKRSRGETV